MHSQELKFIRNWNNIIALYLLNTFSKIMKQKNPSLIIRDSLRIVGIDRSVSKDEATSYG